MFEISPMVWSCISGKLGHLWLAQHAFFICTGFLGDLSIFIRTVFLGTLRFFGALGGAGMYRGATGDMPASRLPPVCPGVPQAAPMVTGE